MNVDLFHHDDDDDGWTPAQDRHTHTQTPEKPANHCSHKTASTATDSHTREQQQLVLGMSSRPSLLNPGCVYRLTGLKPGLVVLCGKACFLEAPG